VDEGRGSSLRGGGHQSYFIHPPNDFKRSVSDWMFLLDAVEQGRIADAQFDRVDLAGGPLAWLPRNRPEDVVFLVTGRDVPPGRAARCLESLSTQKNQGWGAIVIDDGSSELSREHLSVALSPWADRVTLLQPRERRGQLANTAWAIRHVCTNPETVVVTLDLDDALLGSDVVDRVLAEHRRGADVTVGTMLRTDKDAKYPVNFEDPRSTRGGNVWQHLRSFRKRLFDAIPDHELRVDGRYADIAVDWAFMIPIVEAARNPVWIREPLYLYEPSGLGKGAEHDARERQIGALVTRPPRPRRSPEADSNLLTPCQIKPEVWAESGGVLFLRHGERHSFTGLSSSERDAVRLTETGRAAAFALGKKLGGCSGFVSSPMLRSVQTAAAIAEGANLGLVDVHRLQALVDFRVSDVDVFEAAKRRLGWAGMMAAWIDGSLPPNVLMPCETLARNALQSVFAASQQPRIVAVTHDYLIIALLTVLRGVRETAVPYLSGLFVSSQEARTLLEGDGR
jgi:broad specificity phosphatase PhoE